MPATAEISSLNDWALLALGGGAALLFVAFALVAHPRFLARVIAGPQAGELWSGWTLRRGSGASGREHGRRAYELEGELAEQALVPSLVPVRCLHAAPSARSSFESDQGTVPVLCQWRYARGPLQSATVLLCRSSSLLDELAECVD